ncbi:MAG: hypothetical protein ACMG6S_01875 [Byssovorax sp.]
MYYDPQVIVQFAAHLYTRAAEIIRSYTLLGIFSGLVFGGAAAGALGAAMGEPGTMGLIGAAVGAALGGYAGYGTGQEKAFSLKLQAQTALCQVQIEANTRAAAYGRQAA